MKYALSLCLILYCLALKSQTLQGRIVDEASGNPIPFASIGILGTGVASVSNENGDFILKIADFPARIRVSHVSYMTSEISVTEHQEKLVIALKPASIMLNAVTVDPYRAQRIVRQALEKASAENNRIFYLSAFYRQLTTVNNMPSQIYELFYDLKWNTNRVQGWLANKSRYAQNTEGTPFMLENLSYLSFLNTGYLFPEKSGNFVNLSNLEKYQFTIEKYIEQSSQNIAIISCRYKRASKTRYYVNSTYYIGIDDFNIYRVENSFFNLPMTFQGAIESYPPIVSTIATFNANHAPIPILESVSTKMFLQLDARGRKISANLHSLLTVFKTDADPRQKPYQTINRRTKDKVVVESIPYDASFWKDNPIVKQTALEDSFIKMMESRSAFGTMVDP